MPSSLVLHLVRVNGIFFPDIKLGRKPELVQIGGNDKSVLIADVLNPNETAFHIAQRKKFKAKYKSPDAIRQTVFREERFAWEAVRLILQHLQEGKHTKVILFDCASASPLFKCCDVLPPVRRAVARNSQPLFSCLVSHLFYPAPSLIVMSSYLLFDRGQDGGGGLCFRSVSVGGWHHRGNHGPLLLLHGLLRYRHHYCEHKDAGKKLKK